MLKKSTTVAACAALLFCWLHPTEAPARIFGNRRAARASYTTTPANCTGGRCDAPGLAVNTRGGFEGQLTDAYYKQAGAATEADVKTGNSQALPAQATDVSQAKAALEASKEAAFKADAVLSLAVKRQQGQLAIAAAKLQAEIALAEHQRELRREDDAKAIAIMRQKLGSLQAEVATFSATATPGTDGTE